MNGPYPVCPTLFLRTLAAVGAAVLTAIAPALLDAQAPAPLVIDGGTLIDGNGGTPVNDALVIVQGDRITSVSRRGQTTIPANAQVIRADGKFILPGLWDSQVSYNWYYGEVMLNYGITSTIDVGIAGEIGAPHRDAVHKGWYADRVHSPACRGSPPNRSVAPDSKRPARPAERPRRARRRVSSSARGSNSEPT